MRFIWPSQRYDRLTKGPVALATVFTVVACAVTAIPLVIVRRAELPSRPASNDERPEVVAFVVQPRRVAAPNRVTGAAQATPSAARPRPSSKSVASDTASLSPVNIQPTPAADTSSPISADAAPSTRAIGPVLAPSAFSKVIIPEAAKDSIAKRMAAYYLKRLQTFVLTPEQKDSAGREDARRSVAARDGHRPLATALVRIAIPMPFGGKFRSREQQLKDDSVNADNLKRLARLADRARAKRDSLLRAMLAAKRDTDGRGDSLRRLSRPEPRR